MNDRTNKLYLPTDRAVSFICTITKRMPLHQRTPMQCIGVPISETIAGESHAEAEARAQVIRPHGQQRFPQSDRCPCWHPYPAAPHVARAEPGAPVGSDWTD